MSSIGSVNLLSAASEQTGLLGLGLVPPGRASVLAGGFNGSESYKIAFGAWVRSLSHHELMKACSQIPTGKIREIAESARSERYFETASRLELCASLQIPSIGELNPVKSILLGYAPESDLILFFDELDDETIRYICTYFLDEKRKPNLRHFDRFLSTLEIDEGHRYFDRMDISRFSIFLYHLAANNRPHIMKALIKSSKIKDLALAADRFGYALGRAAEKGHVKTADAIINCDLFNKIKPDAIGCALAQAIQNGHDKIGFALINSSRFDEIPQERIEYALKCAGAGNRIDIFHALINSNRFDEISPKVLGETLIRAAALDNCAPILCGLINCRRFDEIPLEAIENALIDAASRGYVYIFYTLIGCGKFDQISPEVLAKALRSAIQNPNAHIEKLNRGISGVRIVDSIAASDKFNEIPLDFVEYVLRRDRDFTQRQGRPLSSLLVEKYKLRKQSSGQLSDAIRNNSSN